MNDLDFEKAMAELSTAELIDLAAGILEDIRLRLMQAAGELEETGQYVHTEGGKE